jgi:uncharacterized repeat protein (TIGR04138 family)
MPPKNPSSKVARAPSLQQVVRSVGLYPVEAYEFVQRGLEYTVLRTHGDVSDPDTNRHITGQQLCEGLRALAMREWGPLAPLVFQRWRITRTLDFGLMVFAMIDAGHMQKTEDDALEDFRDVYDLQTAFDQYRIAAVPAKTA